MISFTKGDATKTCRVCQRHPVTTDHERICAQCRFNIVQSQHDASFEGFLDSVVADIVAARPVCEKCSGDGSVACPECDGAGREDCPQCNGECVVTCWECAGTGMQIEPPLPFEYVEAVQEDET